MATDAEAMVKAFQTMMSDVARMEKSSNTIAKNFGTLLTQMKSNRQSVVDTMLGGIKLPAFMQELSRSIITPTEKLEAGMKMFTDQLDAARGKAAEFQKELERAVRTGADPDVIEAWRENRRGAMAEIRELKAGLTLLTEQAELKKQTAKFTGEQLSLEYLVVRGFKDAIQRSGELNRSLIEANAHLKTRYALSRQIWDVSAKTGASQESMLEAAKALTAVGFDMRGNFKETLMVMVQMKEGLGVAYEHSAEMARIFETNLRTPVREVADAITAIKNQTSLAADEATRFATEIGKALRLLGPGAIQGSAAEVTKYVTMMSARMRDVGGDANEVIKAFQTLTKGTAEGFMLRGMAGVNRPGAMGTEAGSKAAMAGIDRMINQIVRSKPGTMAYTAELEIASQVLGISTESVRLWGDMMKKANQPLTEQQKLQEAWRTQVTAANESLGRIKQSFMALLQRGFTPIIEVVQPVLGWLADLVAKIASNKVAIFLVTTGVIVGIGKVIFSLTQLTAALIRTSVAAIAAAKSETLRQSMQLDMWAKMKGGPAAFGTAARATQVHTAYLGWFGKFGQSLTSINTRAGSWISTFVGRVPVLGPMFNWLGRGMHAGLGTLNTRLWGLVGRLGMFGPVAAVAAAGAAGWALGRLIDKKWPDNWIAKAAQATGEWYAKVFDKANVKTAQLNKFQGDLTWSQLAAQMRQMVYQGRESDVEKHFMSQVHRIKGFESELGGRTLLEVYKQTMAEAREKIGLASVTSAEEEVRNRDLKLIDLTRQGIENTGGSKKLLERAQEDRRAKLAEEKAQRDLAEKQRQTGQRIAPDPHAPTKPRYAIPGKLQ